MEATRRRHLRIAQIGHTPLSYHFPEKLEQALVYWSLSSKAFWLGLGSYIAPQALSLSESKLLLETAASLEAKEEEVTSGNVTGALVIRRERGRLKKSEVEAALEFLSSPPMSEEETAAALAPLIRRRRESEIVEAIMMKHSAHEPLDDLIESLRRVPEIGRADVETGMFLDPSVFERIDRLQHIDRMSLGVAEFDSAVEGGLGKSQLCVFMGKAGDGKSMALVNVAAKAICEGRNVAVASLELEEEPWTARLLANLTGVPTNDILQGKWRKAKEMLEFLQSDVGFGKFSVRWFPPRSTKWSEIKNWYAHARDIMGGRLDVFISDYADKILPDGRHDGTYGAMGEVYEEHRLTAVEWACWAITASQKKSGSGGKADVDDASDSANKGRVTDMIIDLQGNDDGSEVLLRVVKNRHGPSNLEVGPVITDWTRARISSCDRHAKSRAVQQVAPNIGDDDWGAGF